MKIADFTAPLAARFESLAPREKLMVVAASALVGVALVWWIAFAPALRVLRGAEAQHRTLDAQEQRMSTLQAQARAMQSQPRQGQEEALRRLELAIRQQLATSARYSIQGDRVSVTLTNVASETISQWLAQARVDAHALPAEAKLQRNPAGTWDGTLVLVLPPQ
ncbi:MAG TPA: type II secretion system protein GspM [Ramlibacter sp.]|uniref:type II secretion system protein GspM n=1 Tax=Ramlibacter sp. TaxID=1917967 RepID=UPI002C8E4E35|nr:type II secretion system protein GspM [Ramlibacter sp.]HVZ44263.1 type II secretion system protein GspM [Ramlibacter sp.]